MLYDNDPAANSDAAIVRDWLADALADPKNQAKKRTAAALAAECGVTVQATTGWKKTGRMRKKHLAIAIAFFGSAPDFTSRRAGLPRELSASVVPIQTTAAEPLPAWPFYSVPKERFDRLPVDKKAQIESIIRLFVNDFEQQPHSDASGTAAA